MINRSLQNLAYSLIVAIATVIILIYGKNLLIPLVFAALFWFTVNLIKSYLLKLPVLGKIPSWIFSVSISLFILFVISVITRIILANISSLAGSFEVYERNVDVLIRTINDRFDFDIMEEVRGQISDLNFGNIFGTIFNSISDLLSNTFMILLYALFIFLEETTFPSKLRAMYTGSGQYDRAQKILSRIAGSIAKYLGLKTLMSLLTGVLSFIVFYFVGIDAPVFWAFLIFIFNYIPTVGSLIATGFPVLFCFLQFGSFGPGLITLICVGGIQILVGNILDPRLMGNSMNVSPLAVILSLSFWGALWGVIGMILSVPIAIILVIVFAQFESTRNIAILLSQNGNIAHPSDD